MENVIVIHLQDDYVVQSVVKLGEFLDSGKPTYMNASVPEHRTTEMSSVALGSRDGNIVLNVKQNIIIVILHVCL